MNYYLHIKKVRPYLVALAVAIPQVVSAANTIPGISGQGRNGDSADATVTQFGFLQGQPYNTNGIIGTVWARLVDGIFLPILGGIAVLFLVYAGIQYITARGNADATKKARQTIINVMLGIVLLVTTYTIIGLIIGLARHFAGIVG